uniref:Uncharacterized protein LOC114346162 n=1 Tax=Diabrotica virgifera virgifera TaxID=50390 RepID=A0A6P7GTB7_DIAVI
MVQGYIKNKKVDILLDTGSEVSLVNKQLIKDLGLDSQRYNISRIRLVSANLKKISTTNEAIVLTLRFKNKEYLINCFIIEDMKYDIVIGVDELDKYGTKINFANKYIKFGEDIMEEGLKEKEDEQEVSTAPNKVRTSITDKKDENKEVQEDEEKKLKYWRRKKL